MPARLSTEALRLRKILTRCDGQCISRLFCGDENSTVSVCMREDHSSGVLIAQSRREAHGGKHWPRRIV